jgi:hypothetical protein
MVALTAVAAVAARGVGVSLAARRGIPPSPAMAVSRASAGSHGSSRVLGSRDCPSRPGQGGWSP